MSLIINPYRFDGGGGGPWTPAELSPVLWANETSTATDAGSGACSQWNDISGNGRHFTQSTNANRPTIVASGLNGKRVLRFNGTSHWMICDHEILLSALSCFYVITYGNNGGRVIDQRGVGGYGTLIGWYAKSYDNNPGTDTFTVDDGGGAYRARRLGDVGSNIFGMTYGSGTLDSYKNGSAEGTPSGTGTMGSIETSKRIHIGASVSDPKTQFFGGDLAEVLLCPASISTSDRQKAEGYLAHSWGLASKLPSGHPYKDAPP